MENTKHSGLGIASFAISLLTGLFLFIGIVIMAIVDAQSIGGIPDDSPAMIGFGFLIILSVLFLLVSIGLSIGGLVQKQRKKIFAILGLAFSILPLLFLFFILSVGLLVGG